MRTVLITGVQGMDGSILSDKYLDKGWKVIGIDRWQPTGQYPNLQDAFKNPNFIFESGDITQQEFLYRIFKKYEPELVYNMASISLVPESFKIPKQTFETNTVAVINFLEIIREYYPKTKFYQASTSEQMGDNKELPQNTDSKMLPNSPYAISKLASYHLVRMYRNAFGIFAVNGMLWNHEGERRGLTFVTRKITRAVANISHGTEDFVTLGNLDAYRDWGYANDYCDAMILMMEANKPDDYAVNTGETHSIRDFVEESFRHIGLQITWKGKGLDEIGVDQNGTTRVKVDKKFYRPTEVEFLKGDHSKIEKMLGWKPKTKFKDLVKLMVSSDMEETKRTTGKRNSKKK